MFLAAVALSLVLSQQDPATAGTSVVTTSQPAPTQTTAESEEEARRNEVVCRREHVVGSNRPQRICQTRAQWEGLRDRSLERADDGNRRLGQSDAGSSGVPGVQSGG